jgi:hypothetical protein
MEEKTEIKLTHTSWPLSLKGNIYSDKKENQIFLTYQKIQNGAVAKSYMTNGRLLYGE